MSLVSFMKYGPKRDMRKKPPKKLASNKPGPKKSPYAPKNPSGFVSKAIYAKVPEESDRSLERKTYTQLYNLKRPPTDPELIAELGDKLIAWSRNKDSIVIEEFAIENGIGPIKFKELRFKDEYFAECYDLAKGALAVRREQLIGRDLMKSMHPLYNDEWRDYLDHRTRLSKDNDKASQNITVVMEKFPNSPEVPDKED